jgi:hypothetical protein
MGSCDYSNEPSGSTNTEDLVTSLLSLLRNDGCMQFVNWVITTVNIWYLKLNEGRYESNDSNPFSFRKCNRKSSEIYMDDSYIFCIYEAIFPRRLYHFQHTFAN